jgi:hypothetical protein
LNKAAGKSRTYIDANYFLYFQPKNALAPPPNLETIVNCQAQYLRTHARYKCNFTSANLQVLPICSILRRNFTSTIFQALLAQPQSKCRSCFFKQEQAFAALWLSEASNSTNMFFEN